MVARCKLLLAVLTFFFGVGLVGTAVSSAVTIHAHRGGPLMEGKAAFPENSMAAFRHSLEAGYVIEFDLARTFDGVAVVMHDDDLDRTTNCEGLVADHSLTQLSGCRIDRLGFKPVVEELAPGDPRLEPIPTLAQVIDLLARTGGRANIEVKNIKNENPGFPAAVYSQLAASGLNPENIIVQNFISRDLVEAPAIFPGVSTSLLSINLMNDTFAIEMATGAGSDIVSPEWPVSREFVERSHSANLKVVPWTIDDAESMRAAAGVGVDGLITNDPALADRLVGPDPDLSMKVSPTKAKVGAGRTARFTLRVTNSGEGASDPGRLRIKFRKSTVKLVGKKVRRVGVILPGQTRIMKVKLGVRKKAKRGTRTPVAFTLVDSEGHELKRVRKIQITG